MKNKPNIVVVGAGAIGLSLTGWISTQNRDLFLLARGNSIPEIRQKHGIQLEKPITVFLDLTKINHESNDFNPSKYPLEAGLDHTVKNHEGTLQILIEDTNAKESTWYNDDVIFKKLNRFPELDPLHLCLWFLICTFDNFSKNAKQWMNDHNVLLIKIGFHLDLHNKRNFCMPCG